MADKKARTDYVVLIEAGNDAAGSKGMKWEVLGTVTASGAASAKRQALAEHHPEGGTVVAVPSQSWQPEELKPKLSFG
jgi:hypothetical protein